MDPRLEPLLDKLPAWLQPGGPDSDVVVASRVRLARNLAARRFPALLATEEAREICQMARDRLSSFFQDGLILEPSGFRGADADLLVERSLATRDLLDAPRPTLVLFNGEESVGLLVNEEDHFRIQAFASGLNLQVAIRSAQPLSRRLARSFDLARSARYGWLTACPTNTGTGLRASLLLHLPALSRARIPLQRMLQTAQKSFLAVRGVHGEGSRALGHLYQISNQRTLGTDLGQQLHVIEDFGGEVTRYEREVRQALLRDDANRRALIADVERAYLQLNDAEGLSTAEALEALSTLRLAMLCGLSPELGYDLDPERLLTDSFQIQPGHLQARIGAELDPGQRDASRARLLRDSLGLKGKG
ncbi:MAG: hypothetical protein ISR76_03165 [Planctomycetes bacterium]|nr:hypothetical protein [Planctomycetota bacterium]MBL7007971.1 hypothetical protein [Planctomycetota bacterium]